MRRNCAQTKDWMYLKNADVFEVTIDQVETEIKRIEFKSKYYKILRSTINILIVTAAVAVLIATLVLPVVQITGTSMEPTLTEGDIVVLIKTNNLHRGELCAFAYSNKILIKRVIGLPGEFVDIDSKGTVFINNKKIDEPYIISKGLGDTDIDFPFQVPENQYFMLGDQRDTSIDSRNTVIGCITQDQMVGKILFKIWPFSGNMFVD